MKPRVAITSGDPSGIGPEVAAKAAADPRVLAVCEPIVYGPPDASRFAPGVLSGDAGRAAYDVIVRAVDDARRGVVQAMATAPVEATIDLTARELPRFGIARPRIAVAGLNPHAGEHGLFGGEEETAIRPAIAACRARGIDVDGPFPGDTVFVRARRGDFDAVVACYHDQGLIPVKLVAFGQAVNVTLGLPIVRTSVDHGTAFDIAGKGVADTESMIAAVLLASRLAGTKASAA